MYTTNFLVEAKNRTQSFISRNKRKSNADKFSLDLSSQHKSNLYQCEDGNSVYNVFIKVFSTIVELHAPLLKKFSKIIVVYSEWLETNHGVPQRTVLDQPDLFLCINDFREKVQEYFDINQFADDTRFHFIRKNVAELENCVSEILEKTDNYLKQKEINHESGKT